jgi:hypothetical protein
VGEREAFELHPSIRLIGRPYREGPRPGLPSRKLDGLEAHVFEAGFAKLGLSPLLSFDVRGISGSSYAEAADGFDPPVDGFGVRDEFVDRMSHEGRLSNLLRGMRLAHGYARRVAYTT